MPISRSPGSDYLLALVILLLLATAFFFGGRYPQLSAGRVAPAAEAGEYLAVPQAEVWISKDRLFVWNREPAAALADLPARIERFKRQREPHSVSVSSASLARFDDIVRAADLLRKGGFQSVVLETKPKEEPDPSAY